MNYRSYREPHKSPARANAPPSGERSVLDDIDDQAAGYKDDRVQNELLKEICSDIGSVHFLL